MAEFLHMGGYAAFIWSAYGIALLVVGLLIFQSIRDYRVQLRLVEALEHEAGGRVRRAARKPGDEGNP
ncbi:Heme exporter protein D (CcmD) [Parvibaculum lavamentivorans DS-1]|uniref:Heme exporter protein D n=1 Tax=Parvibaculum lavamentivorans (strain DS-1 / DSM 13023 / NCIMB 13966) TaxID=402881 RepID=A7HSZ4_PARL1|nr:heme exporter protein CcmD [Parvibaculum lavamentivorans]ABS63027.1 Heme exporter protein D (CcmD) [Parvibaculum lavamentivorans DS-1]